MDKVDYDCEYCSKSTECGGKCNRFEYDCPFTIVEKYDSEKLKSIRVAIMKISEAIKQLRVLDFENCMENEINSVFSNISF